MEFGFGVFLMSQPFNAKVIDAIARSEAHARESRTTDGDVSSRDDCVSVERQRQRAADDFESQQAGATRDLGRFQHGPFSVDVAADARGEYAVIAFDLADVHVAIAETDVPCDESRGLHTDRTGGLSVYD